MRSLFVIIFFIFPFIVSSQDSSDSTASQVTDSVCRGSPLKKKTQGYFYICYFGDSIKLEGLIMANCCGSHFINIIRNNDSIQISESDTGELCMCLCYFNYFHTIKNCNLPAYRFIIHRMVIDFNTIDTLISNNSCFIENYHNVSEETTRFNYSFTEQNNKIRLKFNGLGSNVYLLNIFDINGKEIKNYTNLRTDYLEIGNIPYGLYFFRIFTKDNKYYSGKFMRY
jgi:hypothetical protein